MEPISVLIRMIRTPGGEPIVDKTGLTGKYDFILHYDPRYLYTSSDQPDLPVDAAPRLADALERQLGLKLVPKKLPFDVLVIDHVDQIPTEN